MKWILLLLLLFITSCTFDPYYELDPYYVIDASGIDFILEEPQEQFAKADYYLIQARMGHSYSKACKEYKKITTNNKEEQAIIYETLASLNCNNKREYYLEQAINTWDVEWRIELLTGILLNNPKIRFNTTEIQPTIDFSNATTITIGKTSINTNNQILVTQVDRVYRDWLGGQLQNPFEGEILTTFSERLTYSKDELRADIGWHEGGRIKDFNLEPITATGTIIAKHNNTWYAPDEKGIFQFEVPLDKVSYPTTRFLTKDIAVIIDTHGINMIVDQAIRNNATLVIGCGDHPGKAKAAVYLSQHNINVISFTDLYTYKTLGTPNILGSPVWEDNIIGNAPLNITKNQKIIVTNATINNTYAIWYYQTPALYFQEIDKTFPLKIIEVNLNQFNQTEIIYEKARETNTSLVATRIFNYYDYNQARTWMYENNENKIILFHSTAYPYAIALMEEFRGRISFDDPNPIPNYNPF
jgi:hypothetical protein